MVTGVKVIYHAIRAAAKALSIDPRYIENYLPYLKQTKPVNGKYTFRFTEGSSDKATSSLGKTKYNITIQSTALKLEVIDVETNEKVIYPSITNAAKILGLRQAAISLYLNNKRVKPYNGKYLFRLTIKPELVKGWILLS